MPPYSIPKCLDCKRICWSRQKIFKCHLCKSNTHAKCLSYNNNSLPAGRTIFFKKCLQEALPFQTINNDDLRSTFRYTIHDLINIFNSIDEQIFDFESEIDTNFIDCKYMYRHDLRNISLSECVANELSIIHLNIRSVFKNFSALKVLLSKFPRMPDIICLSETNIVLKNDELTGKMIVNNDNNDQFIPSTDGYDFIRNDCKSTKGGAGIFVKHDLEYSLREDLLLNVNDCENVWLEVNVKNTKFIVASLYRHPRYNFTDYQSALVRSLEIINKTKINYYIFGDMNINLQRYNINDSVRYYFDELLSFNCHNLINKPTRVSASSQTLIDHIYTNDLMNKLTPIVAIDDTTDHFPTYLRISSSHDINNFRTMKFRDMKNFNAGLFLGELESSMSNISHCVNNAVSTITKIQ